ncbi:hypothetical protein ASF00_01825 [Sphingomonas sp. Leaf34]|uniref:hypothetical protein n=1 Tax=Sphingomonas sp. Leaf34 TaxID=1736216 RepID=UPI0007162000|nr:hypothetical protein [Sphingomonas sp. Leaf34]KQN31566.1 hypothetical protein ASF00_01825 [Sphingomonas sp. Leaf34]
MGKKKDERKRREREAERTAQAAGGAHTHDSHKHGKHKHGDPKHGGAAPFAGIAAALTRQMGTPAGRQVIAAGLMMAANAITAKDARGAAPRPPEPPKPAATPESSAPPPPESPTQSSRESAATGTGPFGGDTATPPRSDAPALPPELTKVIDSVAAGLERFAAGFTKPAKPDSSKA